MILVLFVGGFFAFDYYRYIKQIEIRASDDTREFPFDIEKGESVKSFANRLENDGFIVNKRAFIRYAKKTGLDKKFQAGRYYLAKNLTILELSESLTNGKTELVKITFPEGFTTEEIDARLVRYGLINKGEFTSCVFETCDFSQFDFLPEQGESLRGYFFPSTYFIELDKFSINGFANQMLNAFKVQVLPLMKDTDKSLNDIVIMASILEKETRTKEERYMVSDLFWRRLDISMPLGADATVRFFTKNKTGDITVDDLKEDNPYNTRKHKGLTPTAISNPSLESIKATISPKENKYWYFLHDGKGQIYYAKTLDEHNQNKRKYL